MKKISIQTVYAMSLLAISLSSVGANAALTKVAQPKAEQAIVDDEITPEAPAAAADDEEVVIVKKKPATQVTKKKVVVREQTETTLPDAPVAAEAPIAPPPAAKPTMGQQLDNGVKAKMEDVQNQFEQALLKSLDRIKISVDDGAQPQGATAPTQSVNINDNIVAGQGAPKADYMSVSDAPDVKDDDAEAADGASSVAALPKEEKKSDRKIHVAPVIGKSVLGSNTYNIDSKITAGVELEMDLEKNFSLVLGYSYAQSAIGLGATNPFYGYGQNSLYNGYNSLNYNQNLFEVDGRVYLMPQESKFRIFGGLGLGYNLGYLNYAQNQNQFSPYQSYYNQPVAQDYEVKSWLGILSAGALVNVSDNVSIGALFKYGLTFSSSQNQPLNNYAFAGNGYGGITADQSVVGGSLAQDNFYSILGTVKVAF